MRSYMKYIYEPIVKLIMFIWSIDYEIIMFFVLRVYVPRVYSVGKYTIINN